MKFKKGVDGLKTGFTDGAGYCLTATMKKDGMRIITTVMGEPDSTTRNSEVSSMLDYAFAKMALKKVLSKNSVVQKVDLTKAKQIIEIVPVKDVNVLYEKISGEITPTYKIKLKDIKLPVKNEDIVGELLLYNDSKLINRVNLTVKNDVEKCNLFQLYIKYLKNILKGDIKFNKINL